MGKIVEQVAHERGHTIVKKIDTKDDWDHFKDSVKSADMIIDFSYPDSAPDIILNAFSLNIPVVCGTTGWKDRLPEIKEKCLSEGQALLIASNFSIGVNILFSLNKILAKMMDRFPEYRPSIKETHHIHKKDAPSGTAITLAENIIKNITSIKSWSPDSSGEVDETLPVESIREGEVTGLHEVIYCSDSDRILLKHSAIDRKAFGEGSLLAAEWLVGKKGFFTMEDVLEPGN